MRKSIDCAGLASQVDSMVVDQIPEVFRGLAFSTAVGRKFVAKVLSQPFVLKKRLKVLEELFESEPVMTDFCIKRAALLGRIPRHFQKTCEDLISSKPV